MKKVLDESKQTCSKSFDHCFNKNYCTVKSLPATCGSTLTWICSRQADYYSLIFPCISFIIQILALKMINKQLNRIKTKLPNIFDYTFIDEIGKFKKNKLLRPLSFETQLKIHIQSQYKMHIVGIHPVGKEKALIVFNDKVKGKNQETIVNWYEVQKKEKKWRGRGLITLVVALMIGGMYFDERS